MTKLFSINYKHLAAITLIAFIVACTPLIGPYSPTSYKFATSLKAESLAIVDKAATPYADNSEAVEKLSVELQKAYEYVKGVPNNKISILQWEELLDEEGALLGYFLINWKAKSKFGEAFVREARGDIAKAFDTIICLEANKKKAKNCYETGEE